MAVKVGDLFVELGLKLSKFSKGIEDMQRSLKDVADDMKNVGATMTATITAPIVGMGVASLKAFGDFEQGMNRVKAVTQQSGAAFDAMNSTALELGRTTQFSASQAADAMGFLAMAGFKANEIISAMPSTLQLAAAGAMDLGRAADITSNILTGYGLAVSDLSHANDVLVTGMTNANVDLSMLGESFKMVGPIAKAAGVQFEETAAMIALLGNAGIQGSMAGTSLRKAITSLIAPSKQQAEIMERLGISVTDTVGKFVGFADIVGQLEEASAGAGDMMKLFGLRAGPAMQSAVDQGSDAIRNMTKLMEENAGVAERVAKTQLEGWKGAMTKLKSAVEGTLISIGSILAPTAHAIAEAFTSLAGKVTALAEIFKELPQSLQTGIVAFIGIAAAIGPVILIFGHLLGAAANLKMLGPLLGGVSKAMVTFGASSKKLGIGQAAISSLRGAAVLATPALMALGIAVAAMAVMAVGKGLWNVADAIGGWSTAAKDAAKSVKQLEDATKSEERILKELQQSLIDVKNGVHEFDDAFRRSLEQVGQAKSVWEKFKDAVLNVIAPWRGAAQALDQIADMIRLAKGETKDMGDVVVRELQRINGAVLRNARAEADARIQLILTIRTERKRQAQEEASRKAIEATTRAEEAKAKVNKRAEQNLQARIDMLKRYEDRAKKIVKIQQQLEQMDEEILSSGRELQNMFAKVEQSMEQVGKGVEVDIIVPLKDRLGPAIMGVIKDANELAGAFEHLGVTSTNALTRGAEKTEAAFLRVKLAYEEGKASAVDFFNALVANLQKQLEVAQATGAVTDQIQADLTAAQLKLAELGVDLDDNIKKTNEWGDAWETVSTALTDMGGKIADLIWSGGNLGEVMVNTFTEIGKAITRLALESIAKDLVNSLKNGENALIAFGNSLSKLFGFGGGGADVVTDAAGGAADKASGEIGKALSGPIGMVTSIVDSIVGILGYFQTRRMEKDIGRLEVTSRELKNISLDQLGKMNEYLPWLSELKFLGSIDKYTWSIFDLLMKGGGASGREQTDQQVEYLEQISERVQASNDKLAKRIDEVGVRAEEAAEMIKPLIMHERQQAVETEALTRVTKKLNKEQAEAVKLGTKQNKITFKLGGTTEDLVDVTEDLEDGQGDLARETTARLRTEETAYDGAARTTATYARSLDDLSKTVSGAASIVSGGMSDIAVNAKFAGEEIKKASDKIKFAAQSVGAVITSGPRTLAGPGGAISQPSAPAPPSGGNAGAAPTGFIDPWTGTLTNIGNRTAANYGNNSLQLQVNVNNADARQVADTMIETWRQRGVDL